MKVHVDSRKFSHKPSGREIGGIKFRLTNPDSIQDLTAAQIADCLAAGQTVQPGVTPFSGDSHSQEKRGTRDEDFVSQQIFMTDIDNKNADAPIETPAHAVEVLADYKLPLAFAYPTFNSTPDHVRFRFALVCDEVITDRTERKRIQLALIACFPQSDPDCVNADRIFFGTDKGICEGVGDITAVCKKSDLLAFADAVLGVDNGSTEGKPKFSGRIPVGQRHGTLLRFANAMLTKYGAEDERAFEAYMERVSQCEEPKPDDEVKSIWQAALAYYYTVICKNPDYIPPAEYAWMDAEQNRSGSAQAVRWEKPIPFEDIELPPFPVDALPDRMRPFAEAVAEATQTPVDMAGTAMLAVAATCTQGKYLVRAKADWTEPLNIFVLNVAEPSERKSAVISHAVKPLNLFEMEYNTQHAGSLEKNRMQKRILEKQQRAIEDKVAKGKAEESELNDIVERIATFKEQAPMQLFVDDVTPEKLISVMADHSGIASIISSEGGIFDQLAGGMYSKAVNIDVFLKGHSGDTIRIDRIGRNSECIRRPTLTVLLSVQPSVLSGLMQNGTFRGRGLTARFLYTMPRSQVGARKYRTEPIPQEAKRQYDNLIRDLLDEDCNPTVENPEVITLSPEADAMLEDFANELEPKLRTEYAEFSDWAGKLCGTVVRLGGLLCRTGRCGGGHGFLQEHTPLVVDADTMSAAIALGRYFTEHAKAAYQLMGADPVVKQCGYILEAIKKSGLLEVTRRDIMRLCRSFKKAAELVPALERLCDYGYLHPQADTQKNGPGRPASQTYLVNPALYED